MTLRPRLIAALIGLTALLAAPAALAQQQDEAWTSGQTWRSQSRTEHSYSRYSERDEASAYSERAGSVSEAYGSERYAQDRYSSGSYSQRGAYDCGRCRASAYSAPVTYSGGEEVHLRDSFFAGGGGVGPAFIETEWGGGGVYVTGGGYAGASASAHGSAFASASTSVSIHGGWSGHGGVGGGHGHGHGCGCRR